MNDLTSDLFSHRLPAVQALLRSHAEFSAEKQMEISDICQKSFLQLQNDLVKSNTLMNDSSYKLTDILSNLTLFTTHLKAVQELLQIQITNPSLLALFNEEGIIAVELLNKQLHYAYLTLINQTEEWEQNPQEVIEQSMKKTLENTFTHLINLAPQYSQSHLIPILEKRRDFIFSYFQPYHLFRDQIVEKKYQKAPDLYNCVLTFAETNIPLAEQMVEGVEALKNSGLSLSEIDEFIQKLQSAIRGSISFKKGSEKFPEKIFSECFCYFKSLNSENSPESLKTQLNVFLSAIKCYSQENKLLILTACNSEHGEIYKKLLLSKIPVPKIQEYLLQETGNEDAYYRLHKQYWNLSDWPENFFLDYQLNEKQLRPFLQKIIQKEIAGTNKNKIDIIREFSPTLKEGLFLLYQQIESQPLENFTQKCMQLLGACSQAQEIKNLALILTEDPRYVDFLEKLPRSLLKMILNQSPSMNKIKFISDLEFYFQTHFIPLLKEGFYYEDSLKIYNKDPEHLRTLIELNDSLGGDKEITNIKDKKTLLYFNQHPHLLKAYLNMPDSHFFSQKTVPPESLIQQNREEWIEKFLVIFENSPDLDAKLLSQLAESQEKTIAHLFNQDLSVIKKYQPEFMAIARELIKLLDPENKISNAQVYETVAKMLLLVHSNSDLFKELAKHFSLNHPKDISEFLTQVSRIDNEKTKSALLQLIQEGYYDIACLCLKHQLLQNIGKIPLSGLFEQLMHVYPQETQNQIGNILQFWNTLDKQMSFEELNNTQLSILSKLFRLWDENPKKFETLVSLFCSFPLPEGEKLLQLADWDTGDIDRFQCFLKAKPEFGWHLLDYLINNPRNKTGLLFSYLPTDPQVTACFRTRNPSQALNQMISDKKYRINERQSWFNEKPLPCLSKLPGVDLKFSTENLKKLELLLSDASKEDLIYLQQLCLLEIQNQNSSLVTLLISFYPKKYENLSFLAMEGYSEQVKNLLERTQQEDPLSPLTKLLLDAPPMEGKWLTAALNLDQKNNRLMEHLCSSPYIGTLEKQMTYLAISGDFDTVDQLLNILEKIPKSSQSQALLDWTAQGNLTMVQKIIREDALNMDPMYQKIRACSSSDLQEGLIQLYLNLSENPDMRKKCITWILEHENQKEQLVKLLYLHAQGIDINYLENIDTLFQNNDPKVKLNAIMASTINDSSFSSEEKELKSQFQFAVAASDLLLNTDGSINKGLIGELKKTDFFIENQSKKTTVYKYLDWVFTLLEENGEFSERLVKGTTVPLQASPACYFLFETLGKKDKEFLNKRDVQVAVLSSILQRPWQSWEVGSCFGTSIVSQSQSNASFLLQSLDDYMELAGKNSLQRTIKNCTTVYPLSNKSKISHYEHPFVKAREYCISSMGAQKSAFSIRSMTAKAFNSINIFLGSIARESPEAYEAIQALEQQFTQDFLQGTLEFYDPFLTWKKENLERPGMDINMQGGWVLGHNATCTMIETQEKFETYLLELVEKLKPKTNPPLFQKGITLLKEKIMNHDLSTLKLEQENAKPWVYAEGGFANLTGEIYFEQKMRTSLESDLNDYDKEDHSTDLKLLHTYASCIGKDSKGKISVHCGNHAYSLISEKLLSLNKYQTFDELHTVLSQTSNHFAQLPITQALADKWIDGICLQLSDKAENKLRDYLKKQPLPLSNLQDYGWGLIDALFRASSSKNKRMNAEKVEAAILMLPELKNERPKHIVVGDYNWFDNQNACYAAYAVSPLTNKLEPYYVGEEESNLCPQYVLSRGLEIYAKIAEKPWKPL